MLDLKWIRENPKAFDKAMTRRGEDFQASSILDIDEQHRKYLTEIQELQSERNTVAKQIGVAKKNGEDAALFMDRASEIKAKIPALETQIQDLKDQLQDILDRLPNIALDEVPEGMEESDAQLVHTWGEIPEFSFEPKRHFEIGEALGYMDFETAAAMSGSRFVVLSSKLARLERALAQFMLDIHTREFDYKEISPPLLVHSHSMYGAGQLPKFGDGAFQTTNGHWLVPTAEVPLTNLFREQIINVEQLPMRFVAYTPCFRSEAGAAGKDTRGMIRQHQFHKVELVSITTPDQGIQEHERMTEAAEEILKRLKLPFKRILLSAGDMGSHAQKTYDLEVWLPGEKAYREISSCSVCGDYQARRMKTRYRDIAHGDNKPPLHFPHTLNGSGVAVGRCLVAVLENYQCEDGSVTVPDALIPYMGGETKITVED